MATTISHGLDQSVEGMVLSESASMRTLHVMVAEIAKTDIPVLLLGESGTGKEVYARLIHRVSGLGQARLRKVCCADLGAGRLLAELREEFLPSTSRAHSEPGTVFLDAVHELDAGCQRALLSLLPDGEPKSRGTRTISRLISTTSRNLEREVEAGRFRRDLYFRINGVTLHLPPLRERKEDILGLLNCLLVKHAGQLRKEVPTLSGQSRDQLVSYAWPGNIRELENVARKIVAVGDARLALSDLRTTTPADIAEPAENNRGSSLKVAARAASRRAERELILQALEHTHWNRKKAAQQLQISYKSLLYKIKQIQVETTASPE